MIDSKAVAHITSSASRAAGFTATGRVIVWGDGSRTPAEGTGRLVHRLHHCIRGESAPATVSLEDVLYVPDATTDLISLTVLLEHG